MAAPVWESTGAITGGTGARTPAAPASLAANDVELLMVETANEIASPALSTANGFAELANIGQGTGGGADATRLTVFWRRWDGAAGNPVIADAGNHVIACRQRFSGCILTGNPWDVFGSNNQGAGTSGSISGVETTVDDCLIAAMTASDLPDANSTNEYSSWGETGLVSITERSDNSKNSGNGGAIGVATGVMTSAGATGAVTFTSAETSLKSNIMVALKPVAGGAEDGDISMSIVALAGGLDSHTDHGVNL